MREFSASEIDLSGKNKSIVSAEADAIGYVYRVNNQNYISFATRDEVICGARPEHLRGQNVLISELQETGELKTFWDKIYI